MVEGYKREPLPKLEVHRAEVGKPLLHPDDDCDRRGRLRHAAAGGARAGDRRSNDIDAIVDLLLARRCRSTAIVAEQVT